MQIIFSKKFERLYTRVPKNIQIKFKERLVIFMGNPRNPLLHIHPLKGEFLGMYSLNVTGDYRAIFEKISPEIVVFIIIGTHTELYGK